MREGRRCFGDVIPVEADESVHSVLQDEHAAVRQVKDGQPAGRDFTLGDQAWSKHLGAQCQVLGSQARRLSID